MRERGVEKIIHHGMTRVGFYHRKTVILKFGMTPICGELLSYNLLNFAPF